MNRENHIRKEAGSNTLVIGNDCEIDLLEVLEIVEKNNEFWMAIRFSAECEDDMMEDLSDLFNASSKKIRQFIKSKDLSSDKQSELGPLIRKIKELYPAQKIRMFVVYSNPSLVVGIYGFVVLPNFIAAFYYDMFFVLSSFGGRALKPFFTDDLILRSLLIGPFSGRGLVCSWEV